MSAQKFSTPYAKVTKQNKQPLDASEWNELSQAAHDAQTKINEVIDDIANIPAGGDGGSSSGGSSIPSVVSVSSKGNTTISATKHINIEPAYVANGGSGTYGDVQIKPGDDITLESHHRALDKQDEITIKTSDGKDGSKAPVKLQVIASNLTLSTKGKVVPSGSNDTPEVMNVNVTTGNGKGYLKVRARRMDFRCEEHGGIAFQPKGRDNDGNMNKIKFEHGGGDGLEFGTFNTEKTSLYTDEYRFKKDGVWKMSQRVTEVSDKADENDDTTSEKYTKPTYENIENLVDDTSMYEDPDDFYDLINKSDEQCTTRDIIRTAQAMNGAGGIHTKITDKGNLEIETEVILVPDSSATPIVQLGEISPSGGEMPTFSKGYISVAEFLTYFTSENASTIESTVNSIGSDEAFSMTFPSHSGTGNITLILKKVARSINIESCAGIKLKGILDFGSTFNFGETDGGIEAQYKLTKKNKTKDCSVLKVVGVNNHSSNDLSVYGNTIPHGGTGVIAQVSLLDLIAFYEKLTKNTTERLGSDYFQCMVSDSAPSGGESLGTFTVMSGKFANEEVYSLGYILESLNRKHDYEVEALIKQDVMTNDYLTLNVRTGSDTYETKYLQILGLGGNHPDGDVSMDDILMFIRWAKTNNEGPWAPNL